MIRFASHPAPRRATLAVYAGAALRGLTLVAAQPSIAAATGCPVAAPPFALPTPSSESTLSADTASLNNDIATAHGHVRLTHNGQALRAPEVSYNRKTSRATAHDGLRYYRRQMYIIAAKADVNIDAETGEFDQATYALLDNGGRGSAQKVVAQGQGNYTLTDADYSTCAGSTKAWQLAARRIVLDRASGRGTAYNSTMRLYGIPVLYTPYLNFPIDDKRHSGLLTPTLGRSSDSGFELALPYYFNIAPNYDATFVPRVLADRGVQLSGQFRYLYAHHKGELDGSYLPHDSKFGGDRNLLHYQHIGRFNRHVGMQLAYARVSDDNYFDDLSHDLADTSTSQLERAAALTLTDPGVRFTLLAQDFQTLDSSRDDNRDRAFTDDPYTRLPRANLHLLTPTAPFRAGLDAAFTNFKRNDSLDAYRSEAKPRLLWGIDRGGWFANSEAAYDATRYNLRDLRTDASLGPSQTAEPRGNDVINRGIPSFRAQTGLRFARRLNQGWIQTLEPRMQYLYTGYENQSNIPVFDTSVANLHFERLFAANRFVGRDRIGDANQLTLGVSSRFIAPDSGRMVARLDFGRVTGFRDLKVRIPGDGESGYGDRGSDYVAAAKLNPTRHINARTTVQYDPDQGRVNRSIAALRLNIDGGYRFDMAYRRYRDYRPRRTRARDGNNIDLRSGDYENLEQTALGAYLPVSAGLDVVGRWNYSLARSRNVETLAGLEYRPSCCWAMRVAWRRYVANDDGSDDNTILFQFVLKGLGTFGDTVHSFVNEDVFSRQRAARRSNDAFDNVGFDTIGFQ